jgi:hypothetical protein
MTVGQRRGAAFVPARNHLLVDRVKQLHKLLEAEHRGWKLVIVNGNTAGGLLFRCHSLLVDFGHLFRCLTGEADVVISLQGITSA